MRTRLVVLFALVSLALIAALAFPAATAASKTNAKPTSPVSGGKGSPAPRVIRALNFAVSKPLRDVKPNPPIPQAPRVVGEENEEKPPMRHNPPALPRDPLLKGSPVNPKMPGPSITFEGGSDLDNQNVIGGRVVPPDTNGAVGPNNYVQIINMVVKIFDKSGNLLYGPVAINSFWNTIGGVCQSSGNGGDPVAKYDALADRWLLSQLPGAYNGVECVAISTTNDPSGTYYQYAFQVSNGLNDYPKISVWPDGYYLSFREFNPSYTNAVAVAMERDQMLLGNPAAQAVIFPILNPSGSGCPGVGACYDGVEPSDMDGLTPPPVGSPAYFVIPYDDEFFCGSGGCGSSDPNHDFYNIWQFHVDWVTPASSTFTGPVMVQSPDFDVNLLLVPQASPGEQLDALYIDHYRLVYRNFGDHEGLYMAFTVNTGAGYDSVRWAEIRDPGGSPSLYQSGTFDPGDSLFRWMPSIGVDASGNIAVGYSVSSSSMFPAIRWAGRLVTDPLGDLTQGEATMWAGTGAQTSSSSRWGDYSAMVTDSTDGCTFWYTTEYYATTGSFDFHTRIGNFNFGPSCSSTAGTLSGHVTDSGTSAPIAGALVQAGAASTLTAADGSYSMLLAANTYSVTASSYGYFSQTVNGVVVTQGNTTTQDFALSLAPTVDVCGTVSDGGGHVYGLYARIDIAGYPGGPVFTNPIDGTYCVTLVQDTPYTFNVSAIMPGYVPQSRPVTPPAGGATENFLMLPVSGCTTPGYSLTDLGLITNPGFETGDLTGWTVDGTNNAPVVTNAQAHSGTYSAEAGNDTAPEPNGDSSFYQQFAVPPTGGTLTFWTKKITFDNINFDWQDAYITDSSGNILQTIFHTCNTSGWTLWSVDLAPYASQTIRVKFLVHQDGFGDVTGMWIDDVSVGACELVPGGLLVGNVYDANTGNGLNGAKVTSNGAPTDQTTTFATPADPAVDDGFYILFSSITGTGVPFTGSKNLYGSDTEYPNIGSNAVTGQNFNLQSGDILASPNPLEDTVALGTQDATPVLTLDNIGGFAAGFQIQERKYTGVPFKPVVKGKGAPLNLVKGHFSPLFREGAAAKTTKSKLKEVKEQAKAPAPAVPPWTGIANYPNPIMDNTCDVINGLMYCVGGFDGTNTSSAGNVYDPGADAWTSIAAMADAREKPAAVAINGLLYVTGGWDTSGNPDPKLEIYDPSSNTWTTGAPNPSPMAAGTAVNLNGLMYIIGGCPTGSSCGATNLQVYDPSADSWSSAAVYPELTSWIACGVSNGKIYCGGGVSDSGESMHTNVYDPGADSWTGLSNMPQTQWGSGFTIADDKLYVSGGVTGGALTNQTFVYDPVADAWSAIENSNNTLYRGGSACGLYKVGGSSGGFTPVPNSEVYPGLTNCGGTVDIPWLSENPTSGSVPAETELGIAITFDASQVNQPGDYYAKLHIKTDTPNPVPDINVKMTVPLPSGWGWLDGHVTGLARCDQAPGAPLKNASVLIHPENGSGDFTVSTDATGYYKWALDASTGPVDITVTKTGFITGSVTALAITAGNTTTQDFALRPNLPCIDVQPTLLEDTVALGLTDQMNFYLTNSGAGSANFQIFEGNGHSLAPQKPKAKAGAPVNRVSGAFNSGSLAKLNKKSVKKPAVSVKHPVPYDAPWVAIANYPTSVMDNTCASINGELYCVGGIDGGFNVLSSGYVYDSGSNTWTGIASMNDAREKPAVAAINGLLYVTGGWGSTGNPDGNLEIYDPGSNTWSTGSPNPTPYAAGTGVNFNNLFYVIGGCDSATCGHTDVMVYDPGANSWSTAAAYPEPISWEACGAIAGDIYCAGGVATNESQHTYAFDGSSWTQLADMPQTQWAMGFTAANNLLYISGGVTANFTLVTNQTFFFDPSANSWTADANSNNSLYRGGSGCGFDKVGGSSGGFSPVASSEQYPGLNNCAASTDVPWISENPTSGTLDPNQTFPGLTDIVTFDASQVNQPGDYLAHLKIQTSYTIPDVQITMHVPLPAGWGYVYGTITGLGRCDAAGNPLNKATVVVHPENGGSDATLTTDATGHYQWALDATTGPVDLTISAKGYVTQTPPPIAIPVGPLGSGPASNFSLRLDAPCASKSPASFDVSVSTAEQTTLPLTLSNIPGAGTLTFQIFETGYALPPLRPILPKAVSVPKAGKTVGIGPLSMQSIRSPKTKGLKPVPSLAWFSALPVPGGIVRYAHAQCDTDPNGFYVISGVDGTFSTTTKAWRFDATSNTWNALASFPSGVEGPSATCYQGRIYVLGGGGTTQFYVYDIASNTWLTAATLPRPMWGAAVGSWNGKVYMIGGDQDFFGSGTSSEVDVYDILSNTWTGTATPMPTPAVTPGYVQAGNFLYIVGGWIDGIAPASNNVASQRYDMASDTWTAGPDLPSGRADLALAITDTALYAIGGDNDGGGFFDSTTGETRLEWAPWPGGSWTSPPNPLPEAVTANNAGFCTHAFAASEVWSIGGLDVNTFTITGDAFLQPSSTEHCFTIFSDVPWLSESPTSDSINPDSNEDVNVTFNGTVVPAGDYNAVLVVTTNDSGAPQFNIPVTMHVHDCPTITLPGSLADGTVGDSSYDQSAAASGGASPYTYSVTGGALPTGLSIDPNTGEITGTPSAAGSFNFTITATDSEGCTGSQSYTVTMTCPAMSMLPASVPDTIVGSSYDQTITASGSLGTFTYSVSLGSLPTGLSIDPNSGEITGTSTAIGTFNFVITAMDQYGCATSTAYSIRVACATITLGTNPSPLPVGVLGVAYPGTITTGGGYGLITLAQTGGTVPPGLTFNPDGTFSGTPTASGTFTFTVLATDAAGCTQSGDFTIVIALFYDDFNDGDYTTPSWTVTPPSGAWSASSGDLVGTSKKKITALSPTFGSGGCTTCEIVANMVVGNSGENLSLVGWYTDPKNFVEIRLQSGTKGKVMLWQKSGGKTVKKQFAAFGPMPAGQYNVDVKFDGVNFNVTVKHGATTLSFPVAPGAVPHGLVLFQLMPKGGIVMTGTLQDVTVL